MSRNAHTHCVPTTVVTHRLRFFFFIFYSILFFVYFTWCCSICYYYLISTRVRSFVRFVFSIFRFHFLFIFVFVAVAGAKLAEPSEQKRWSRQDGQKSRESRVLVALTGRIINQHLWARKLAKWKYKWIGKYECVSVSVCDQANGPTVMPPAPWAGLRLRLHFDRSLVASQRQRIVGRGKHYYCYCCYCCNYWFLVG